MRRFAACLFAAGLAGSVLCAVPAAARPYVYVADPSGNTVTVVDAQTNTIAQPVSALTGASAVAASVDGTRAYAAESGSGKVAIIDTSRIPNNPPVTGEIAVGGRPVSLALGPDGNELFVVDAANDRVAEYDLSSVDPANPAPAATFAGPAGLAGMALAPDGQALALYSDQGTTVAYYNLRHQSGGAAVRTDISVPAIPSGLTFSDDGSMLWIATGTGFSTWDRATGKVNSHAVSGGTRGVVYSARGPSVYFGATTGDAVYAWSPDSGTLTTITLPAPPAGLAVSPDGTRVYAAANCSGCGLDVIDATQEQFLTSVGFGQAPKTAGRYAGPGDITAQNGVVTGLAEQQLSGTVAATDAQQRTLTYSVVTPPASGQLTFDGSTGNFVYTPPSGSSGLAAFVWTAAAASGQGSPVNPESRPVTETLAVAPAIGTFANQSVDAGATVGPLSFTLDGTMPLDVKVTSDNSAVVDAANATLSPGCGTTSLSCTLTLVAGTSRGQSATVTVAATDPDYLNSKQTFRVSIKGGGSGGSGGGAFAPMMVWLLALLAALPRAVRRIAR